MRSRIGAALALGLALAACGSEPPKKEPAALSAPAEAMRMGMLLRADDEYRTAVELFGRALQLYRSTDDRTGQLNALVNLADAAVTLGESARALEFIGEARRIAALDRNETLAGRLDLLEAQALAQAGRRGDARRPLEGLLARESSGALAQAAILERARVALEGGDGDAMEWLNKARSATAGDSAPRVQAAILKLEAEAARRANDPNAAASQLEAALDIYRKLGYRPGIAAANEALAALAAGLKRSGEARDRWMRALDTRFWLRDRVHAVADLEALRALEKAAGDARRAKTYEDLAAQLRTAEFSTWPDLEARVRLATKP